MGADGGASCGVFVCNLCGAQCTAGERPEWDQIGHVLGIFECSRCREIPLPTVKGDAERGNNKPVPERAQDSDSWPAEWLPDAVRAGAWVNELPAPGRLSEDEPEVEEAEPAPEPEMWEDPSTLPPWPPPPPAATARGTKRKAAAHGGGPVVTPAAPASAAQHAPARVQDRRRRPAHGVPLRLDLQSLSGAGPEQPVERGSPMIDQRACKACQRAKSSCSFTAAEPGPPGAKCSRCERLGIACVPNPPRHRACQCCRDAKEKCRWGADPERCLRCARLGIPCVRPSGPGRATSAPERLGDPR